MAKKRRVESHDSITIDELEQLLNADDENEAIVQVLPNGKIILKGFQRRRRNRKPLTFKRNLGGEYADEGENKAPQH